MVDMRTIYKRWSNWPLIKTFRLHVSQTDVPNFLTLSILEILLGNLDSLLGNHCKNKLEDEMVEGKLYMLDEDNPLDCVV